MYKSWEGNSGEDMFEVDVTRNPGSDRIWQEKVLSPAADSSWDVPRNRQQIDRALVTELPAFLPKI